MRQVKVKLKKGGRSFIGRREFYEREVVEGLTGCIPGQWVVVEAEGESQRLLGLANPMNSQSAPIRILCPLGKEIPTPEEYIENCLKGALKKREGFKSLSEGKRLVFGDSDGLPGVIVDEYSNCILIQINTAGLDTYRALIKETLQKQRSKDAYFLDNEEYRKGEGLPLYDREEIPELEVAENGIAYRVPKDILQKIGYYYDHRVNRRKLAQWIEDSTSEYKSGVDLFCYGGSWGLNALKAGVQEMTFIDQGNLTECVEGNLKLNGWQERGRFERANVFDWLKNQDQTYDVVISDPPAFSKSLKNKSKALGGYQKLHRSLSQLVHKGSLLAIGSCTHGVSLEELDQTVKSAFSDTFFELQLLDVGVQGPDHPISHFSDGQNYIKFMLYRVL